MWTPRILDLGCGDGWLSAILTTFGSVTGVDLAPESAAARFPRIPFLAADFGSWKPDLDPFDVIVSQEVIEHMEDQNHFVDLASDLLKPGGHLILTTPNARVTEAWRGKGRPQPIEHVWRARELGNLLSRRFHVHRLHTILPSYKAMGEENAWTGIHYVLNSEKVRTLLRRFRLLRLCERTQEARRAWTAFCGRRPKALVASQPAVEPCSVSHRAEFRR